MMSCCGVLSFMVSHRDLKMQIAFDSPLTMGQVFFADPNVSKGCNSRLAAAYHTCRIHETMSLRWRRFQAFLYPGHNL